ncbi:hypothetical protein G3580_02525 [Nitrogeniibacter mangrovi]|uniref:Uncharacterized protein n=1 Tax=Nitrogeniibacter mangrovi TaxID=2016596 RepID=A0A6C1B0T2_9RHOO|nr:hypothetical protein [Nitrogeniibacter mangrovi]QID16599.1 hypothetical protein G3580_02525 [Nitrogeniibacter mangrovi]
MLLESVRDVCFLYEVVRCIKNVCGNDALSIKFAVQAMAEMRDHHLIDITVGEHLDESAAAPKGLSQLDRLFRSEQCSFCTVTPTDKGREWVERYWSLFEELNS